MFKIGKFAHIQAKKVSHVLKALKALKALFTESA